MEGERGGLTKSCERFDIGYRFLSIDLGGGLDSLVCNQSRIYLVELSDQKSYRHLLQQKHELDSAMRGEEGKREEGKVCLTQFLFVLNGEDDD